MTMLEYVKMILEKVSFDKVLFEKELKKGMSLLVPSEISQLQSWCYEKFTRYKNLLNQIFTRVQFG